MKKRRRHCERCAYPEKSCVCAAISTVNWPGQVHIIQHPSEENHAKNTARLIPLILPNTHFWRGESNADFQPLRAKLENSTPFLLYPSNDAVDIDTQSPAQSMHVNFDSLIIIDGTWRKAYKIYQLNTWLHCLQHVQLTNVESQYTIRSTRKQGVCSSLEAVYWALSHLIPQQSFHPLMNIFNKMQSNHLQGKKNN